MIYLLVVIAKQLEKALDLYPRPLAVIALNLLSHTQSLIIKH